MMADGERGLSALGHGPVPAGSSARWYRFDIDCAAHPAGVSVRNLMREADGPRRKVKNSASAPSVAANGTTVGGPAATAASNRPVAPEAASTSAAAASGTPEEGAEAPGSSTSASVKVGSGTEIGGSPSPPDSAVARKILAGGGGGGSDAVGTGGPATAQDAGGGHGDTDGAVGSSQAGPSDSAGAEPGPETSAGGPQHRASNWMSVIERLELEYGGGGGLGGNDSPSGSGSDDSEGEDGEDRGGSGGDAGGAGGGGEGGDGGGGKKKAKAKKKSVRKHSFDYEDDFIDDSELEKQYYAKEASNKVQTVHSGFFANQGAVATVEPDGGKEGSGGAGGGDGGGAGDGELNIRKKKKPKTSSTSNEAGEGTTTTGASKKRKPPPQPSEAAGAAAAAVAATAGVGGAKKILKVSEQQQHAAIADHSAGPCAVAGEISGSTQQILQEIGSSTALMNGAMRSSSSAAVGTATSGAGAAAAGAPGALSGANGSSAMIGRESDGTSPRQARTGGAASPGNGEAKSNDASATDAGAASTVGAGGTTAAGGSVENGGKAGAGEKGGKNGMKLSAPTWDLKLETAMAKFEEDTKAWVAGGRAAGEEAERVVEEMRAIDVFARRILSDVHNSRTYLVRLSAVYGKPPLEMKTMLIELKEQGDREECARLQKEFNALKLVFVSEVAACVGQLKASGQPLTPPFTWSDGLRGHLHDLLKAFEAWSLKEHGGPRTRQALSETKALYDQLAQEWPAELTMTADCLRKMFNNEKRRIKAKANKEAAAEAGTALPPTTSGTVTPTGVAVVSSADMPPTSSPSSSPSTAGAAAAPAVTAATVVQTSSANQSVPGGGALAATTAANINNIGFFAGGPARQQQQQAFSMPPPVLQRLQQAPASPVAPPRSSLAKETPASTATASGTPSPAPSPPVQRGLPTIPVEVTAATANGTVGSLSFAEASTVALSRALSVELMPPRGSRFDMPPSFDPRNFEEEIDEDEVAVMGVEE